MRGDSKNVIFPEEDISIHRCAGFGDGVDFFLFLFRLFINIDIYGAVVL